MQQAHNLFAHPLAVFNMLNGPGCSMGEIFVDPGEQTTGSWPPWPRPARVRRWSLIPWAGAIHAYGRAEA